MNGIEAGRTGRMCRNELFTRGIKILVAGLGLCTLGLATAVFLWQILKAAGDLAGASMFLAMTVVALGIWVAHWCGLILLNSLSLSESNPPKRDSG